MRRLTFKCSNLEKSPLSGSNQHLDAKSRMYGGMAMRLAILLMVHKNLEQVQMLISAS